MTQTFWYLSRAAGITSYLLLFISVSLGLAVSTRGADRILKRATTFDLHRFVVILALCFSVFHVLVLLGDGYFKFNIWQLAVPFLSPYRTWQTAVGVFSIYLMMLVILSFYLRRFIGYRTWRTLHYVTFALYAGVTLHGVTAGTDTTQLWAKLMYIGTGAVVFGMLTNRMFRVMPGDTSAPLMRAATSLPGIAVVLVLALGTGLFHAGGPPATTANALTVPASYDEQISGTFSQTADQSQSHFTMLGAAEGDLPMRMAMDVAFAGRQTVSNTANIQDPKSGDVLCSGKVVDIQRGFLSATCEGAGPYVGLNMAIALKVSTDNSGNFSGTASIDLQRDGQAAPQPSGGDGDADKN